jgi:hypothetical protein
MDGAPFVIGSKSKWEGLKNELIKYQRIIHQQALTDKALELNKLWHAVGTVNFIGHVG